MEATRPLAEIVANRRWERRLAPFPHVVVRDLFVPSVAEEIDSAVKKILEGELGGVANYDASGWSFPADVDWPLRLFVTAGWRELIAGVLGIDTIPYVSGGVHHHEPGGQSGGPHNDLNPVYFADTDPGDDGMVVLRGELVDLKSGARHDESFGVIRTVRAASILYYTANPEWQRGDGGQTGLYSRRSDPVDQPVVAVPPINNSLVAFECTPNSFHSFISNRVTDRNSITMWLHQSDNAAATRWGESTLERWAESPPLPASEGPD